MNVTIRPGKRPAFSEVVFSSKPEDASLLADLKAAGWNWHNPSGCWYGPTATLPERIKSMAESQPEPEATADSPVSPPVGEPELSTPAEDRAPTKPQPAPGTGIHPMSELPEPKLKNVWNGLVNKVECSFVTDGICLIARSVLSLKGKHLAQLEKQHAVAKKKGCVEQSSIDKMIAKYASHATPATIEGWTAECGDPHPEAKDTPPLIARLSSTGNRVYVNAERLAWMLNQIKASTGNQARLMLAVDPDDKLPVIRFANGNGETIGLLVGCYPLESWHARFDGSLAQPPKPEPDPAPVAHVARDVAAAFGISKLPNVVVVPVNQDSPSPAPKSNVIPLHQPGSLSGLKARAATMRARLARLRNN